MSERKPPPRSLRSNDSDGPRYYRDWSSYNETMGEDAYMPSPRSMDDDDDYDEPAAHEPAPGYAKTLNHEAYDDYDDYPNESPAIPDPEPYANPASDDLTDYADEAPPPMADSGGARKSTIVKRARRASERQDDIVAPPPPEQPAAPVVRAHKTGNLAVTKVNTAELKTNIKEMATTLEDTKKVADSLTQNVKEMAAQTTLTVLTQAKAWAQSITGFIQGTLAKRKKKGSSTADQSRSDDFDDAPYAGANIEPPPLPQKTRASSPEKDDVLPPVPDATDILYADLLSQGITFQTFDKKPMLALTSGTSSEIHKRFLVAAVQDVKRCIKLVEKLPAPTEGPYAGVALNLLFSHVREKDICFFLYYVRAKANTFKGKDFKFSEVFASWVLKRSHQTMPNAAAALTDNFPKIPILSYAPLFNQNIKFQTFDRKAMVLGTNRSTEEIDTFFITNAVDDIRKCVKFVEQFPPPKQGPYSGMALKDIFVNVKERDIYFFLHYVKDKPEMFRNKNFKLAEVFASWILSKSHETNILQG